MTFVDFAYISPYWALDLYWELNSSLNNSDLSRLDRHLSHFCYYIQSSLLRYDQIVTITVVKRLSLHRSVCCVNMNGNSLLDGRVSTSSNSYETLNKIGGFFWHGSGFPSYLIRNSIDERTVWYEIWYHAWIAFWIGFFKWFMADWGLYSVEPWSLVVGSG